MKHLRKATEMAFDEVPPTCETVGDILQILADKYDIPEEEIEFARKVLTRLTTERLRNALIGANATILNLQAETRRLAKLLPAKKTAAKMPARPKRIRRK